MRYAITNLQEQHPGGDLPARQARAARLLQQMERWTAEGLDYVQLREKALGIDEVYSLAEGAAEWLRAGGGGPKLLLAGRPDAAAAAGADGVHLSSRPGELTPGQARSVMERAGRAGCVVSVSCHRLDEVEAAREGGADVVLFAPVYEKRVAGRLVFPGQGLGQLRLAVAAAGPVPLLALGGVTEANTAACLAAGAAGVAGIRLFG